MKGGINMKQKHKQKKKQKYASLLLLLGFSVGTMLQTQGIVSPTKPIEAEAAVPTYSQTIQFPERSYSSGSETITIPNNARNIQAYTNNGSVSTSQSGTQLTVNVSGGSYHRTGSNYDSTYYSSSASDSRSGSSSSSGSYPYSISYSSGAYSGTLYQSGSPYVSSGSYTPADTRTFTATRTTSEGGSTADLPSSIAYNSGGYVGTLTKSSSSVLSGSYTAAQSFTVNTTRETSKGGSPSSLPSSVSYNSSGYTGTLSKAGSAEVLSGSYTAGGSKTATDSASGGCTDHWVWSSGAWRDAQGGATWNGATTKSYDSGGYSGTLRKDSQSACSGAKPTSKGREGQTRNSSGTMTVTYSGTVTKPEVDTRVWTQAYSGKVTKPAVDNRVWEQNYSGSATKPAVDTRGYSQPYSGTVYAGGYATNYWYQYGVTVTYEADLIPPTLNVSYDKDAGIIRATATDDEYGMNYIQLPNGSTVNGGSATYSVSTGGTYNFTAVDAGGNTTVKSITLVSPPINTSVEVPNTTWTKQDSYLLSISTTPTYDTDAKITLQKDGVKVKENTANSMTYDLADNGSYRITVKDGSIISTKDITISNFDRTAPNGNVTYDGSTPNDGLDINVTSTDSQSGIKSITLPNNTVVTTATANYKVLTEGSYDFVVEDKVGNKRTVTAKVDKPTLSITKSVPGQTNASSYTLNASMTPKYVTTAQIKNFTTNTTTTTNSLNYSVSSNGSYKFQGNDGGVLTDIVEEVVGNFDRIAPNGTITLDGSTPDDGLDIKVDATDDASGIKSITLPDNSVVNADKAVYKTKTSGTFSFIIEDGAGNKKTVTSTINKPTLTMTKEITTPTNGESMKLTGKFTPQYVTTGTVKNETTGEELTGNQVDFVVTENGTYRFRANDGGVLSDYVDVVVGNFDRNAPNGTITIDGSTPNDGLDINLTTTDDNAGVKNITLPNKTVVTTTTANFKTTQEGSFDFIIEDKAGNKRTVTAVVQKPTINVTKAISAQTNASSYNLTASFTPKYVTTGQVKNVTTGSTSTTNSLNYAVSSNGSYKFQANDGGLWSDIVTVDVTNFDRTAPTGVITYDGSTPNDGLNIIVNATDTESPIKSITQPDNVVKTDAMVDYSVTTAGDYNFIIEDTAGNKRTVTATVTKPTGTATKTVTAVTNLPQYQVTVTPSTPKYVPLMKIDEMYRNETFDSNNLGYMVKENGNYRFRLNDGGIVSDFIDVSVTNFDRTKPVITFTDKAETATSKTVNIKINDVGDTTN